MQLEQILSPASCRCDLPGANKKRILKTASELVAANLGELATDNIFDALMAREQLGSTGLGSGIAIPHCRVAQCQDILGALITLEDILFVLIVPELQHDEHIKTLAGLAELFNDEDFCEALRHTHDSEKLYKLVINY